MDPDFQPRPRPRPYAAQSPSHPPTAFAKQQTIAPRDSKQKRSAPKATRGKHRLLSRRTGVLTTLCISLLIVGVIALEHKSTPVMRTAGMFMAYAVHGKTQDAFSLTTETFRQSESTQTLQNEVAQLDGGKVLFHQQEAKQMQAAGHQTIVVYSLQVENNTKYVRLELSQIKGSWLISNVIVSSKPQNTLPVS